MENFGFIHEKLDIKLLILFVLNRLPAPVDELTLSELVMFDDGILYFDYSECLQELVAAELVIENSDGFAITEKGAGSITFVESSLPYSVRSKAQRLISPVEEKMRRNAMIVARHSDDKNGGIMVELAVTDGSSELMHLKLVVPDEKTATSIEKRFRPKAEEYYLKIAALLAEE